MSLDPPTPEMQAVLAEYGITLGPLVAISTLPPGTLARRGEMLVMLENKSQWGYFGHGAKQLRDFDDGWPGCQVQVVVEGIPPDVWSTLRDEPSNTERVRIAAASVGLAKTPQADALAPPPTGARLRQDIIATASVLRLKLGAPIAAHTMPPGTLALEGGDDARNSTMLALMEDDGNWGYLIEDIDHTKAEFGDGGQHQQQTVLVTGIPSHAWLSIRAEKSQIARVRIAAMAVAAAKVRPLSTVEQRRQIIATADSLGLSIGPLVQIDTLPTGTLALFDITGNLALVENDGCWGYLSEGCSSEVVFTRAYGSQLAHELCTGLAPSVWMELRASKSQVERVNIAAAAAAMGAAAAAGVAAAVSTQRFSDEVLIGLVSRQPGFNLSERDVAALLDILRDSPSAGNIAWALNKFGIASSRVRTNGGGEREDLTVSLNGWPYLSGSTAARGDVPLETMTVSQREARLLAVTRERRLAAHLWQHRGIVRRLRSWSQAYEPVDAHTLDHMWRHNESGLRTLGVNAKVAGEAIKMVEIGAQVFRGPHAEGRWINFGVVLQGIDLADTVGRVLRQIDAGLRHEASPTTTDAVIGDGWLADSVPFTFDETYGGWCGSARSLVGDILGCLQRDVNVRCVTADRSAVVQAPISLRTFQAAPGTSICVEVDVGVPLGSCYRQEALAAAIARGMRMRNRKVDNVYVTQRDSSQDAACELTPPKPKQ